jgi:hypothetical protein
MKVSALNKEAVATLGETPRHRQIHSLPHTHTHI